MQRSVCSEQPWFKMRGVVPHYHTQWEGGVEAELWPPEFKGLLCPVWQPLAPALWLSRFWFRHMAGSCVTDLESFTGSVLPRCTCNAVDCSGIITEKVSQTECWALQYAIWEAPQLSCSWVAVLAFLQGNFWKMRIKPLNTGFEPTKLTLCIHT